VTDRRRLPSLVFRPLTRSRWADFERLFGERGACGGCWCMWWRLRRSEFERTKGEGNRRMMKKIVESGRTPGILAYAGRQPVAWVSVAPREDFPVLGRSRILKPIDDAPAWSIVCFFIRKDYRRRGMTGRLIRAAVEHAARNGARIVEAYPIDPKKDDVPTVFAFTGFASAFRRAGFRECARRSPTRPIMRRTVKA
jgi:GNAT superfamily N-acetyltransferase